MIKSIEINKFRCFDHTKLAGFSRVNLIGGQNNSGKTVLLEALYLNNSPSVQTIMFLRRLRKESESFSNVVPERTWDSFFFDQNKEHAATIISEDENEVLNELELSCDDFVGEFEDIIKNEEIEKKDIIDLGTLLSNREATRSVLHLKSIIKGEKQSFSSIVAHSRGIMAKDLNIPDVKKVNFIPAFLRLSNAGLAEAFDKADLNGSTEPILEAIRMIDDSIIQIKTLSIGTPAVYLQRKNEHILPISLFGEAISKIAEFVLRLVNNKNSILLIDEIENGIHHTRQQELWKTLFKLSVNFDVQIFATTHSLEMIQAFAEVGQKNLNHELASYIELARNIKTGQLTGIKRDVETLNYELERGMEMRGE